MKKIDGMKCLQRLADHLRDYKTPIRPAWADEAQAAILAFLNGEAKTLDAAFGLKRRPGHPADPKRKEFIARKAIALRKCGFKWVSIAAELEKEKIFLDESVIREYAGDFEPQILLDDKIEELAKDIISDLKTGK